MQPLAVIRAAIQAVPAVKYALGVAGIFAVVAIISAFGLDARLAAAGAILVLMLMVALVIFARLTSIAPRHFLKPALVMTWAFLIVTVATAVLLCSSVFFGIPLDVKALVMNWNGTNINTNTTKVVQSKTALSEEGARLLEAARFQMDSGTYSAAWKTLEQLPPDESSLEAIIGFKATLAQVWLRNIRTRPDKGETFAGIVDAVTPALVTASKSTDAQTAATALAHLGYGNFLRWRETREDLKIADYYDEALKLDGKNPFAHTFWGHWIFWEHGAVSEGLKHFAEALQSADGATRPIVRKFQLAALTLYHSEKLHPELLRALNEMRIHGEPLSDPSRYESELYYPRDLEFIAEAGNVISKSDHLATYQWLTKDLEPSVRRKFITARLTEEAGQFAAALPLYRELTKDENFDRFTRSEEILEGIARCEKAAVN